MSFDVIVIGSGFGGAITACRLAEAGAKVLILERGQWWTKENFPRKPDDQWLWCEERAEKEHGWLDLRVYKDMSVAQGAAVGGGSLIYANISAEAPRTSFATGWPAELTYDELKPHYDRVKKFMNVQKVPNNQWPPKMKLVKEAADKLGFGARFEPLELAVTFDPDYSLDQPDPYNHSRSKQFINEHGAAQGTCVHLGNCDIGCEVYAKNTLDRNYIPAAQKHGAQVRALHRVKTIRPEGTGYRVDFDDLRDGKRTAGSESAKIVIVAAGSMGSTELLLQCRDLFGTLPKLSPYLGHGWSSNGDFLTPALHFAKQVKPSVGPTITAAIDFLDSSQSGQSFWIQDGGLPNLLLANLTAIAESPATGMRGKLIIDFIRHGILRHGAFDAVMPWFAQGVDAADGRLTLRNGKLHLDWDIDQSAKTINTIVDMHKRLAKATGGVPLVPPTWTWLKDLITPHPLGGCNVSSTPAKGVVDHTGEVFGYRNLYVADGAIIPRAVGVNPSRTIGALAERVAAMIIEKEKFVRPHVAGA